VTGLSKVPPQVLRVDQAADETSMMISSQLPRVKMTGWLLDPNLHFYGQVSPLKSQDICGFSLPPPLNYWMRGRKYTGFMWERTSVIQRASVPKMPQCGLVTCRLIGPGISAVQTFPTPPFMMKLCSASLVIIDFECTLKRIPYKTLFKALVTFNTTKFLFFGQDKLKCLSLASHFSLFLCKRAKLWCDLKILLI